MRVVRERPAPSAPASCRTHSPRARRGLMLDPSCSAYRVLSVAAYDKHDDGDQATGQPQRSSDQTEAILDPPQVGRWRRFRWRHASTGRAPDLLGVAGLLPVTHKDMPSHSWRDDYDDQSH